jgi:hypothetical protein
MKLADLSTLANSSADAAAMGGAVPCVCSQRVITAIL